MGAQENISPELAEFIARQPVFFVSTAPLSREGHINLSPKGLDTLRVLSPTQVAYLDLTGSGNETAAHLLENGRVTIMLCAFEGSPKILRLYGAGRPVMPEDRQWPELAARFPEFPGARQIFLIDVERVSTSCGFGIPIMKLEGERDALPKWAEKKGPEEVLAYQRKNNTRSIDGLPTSIHD